MKSIAVLESDLARDRADINAIRQGAADEGRAESADERAEIDRLVRKATDTKAQLDRRRSDEAIGASIASLVDGGPPITIAMRGANGVPVGGAGASPFMSAGGHVMRGIGPWLRDTRAGRPQQWESPAIEVPYASLFAATLTSDPASGGDLVVPDYRPGILPSATRPLVVSDLLASGTTESNLITYMVEKTFVNAADTVLEGGLKPESSLTFDAMSDPVRKIAHWLPVT